MNIKWKYQLVSHNNHKSNSRKYISLGKQYKFQYESQEYFLLFAYPLQEADAVECYPVSRVAAAFSEEGNRLKQSELILGNLSSSFVLLLKRNAFP